MDKTSALEKIKKCLRLAASDNPNEAATALRQAKALMSRFQVGDEDVLFSEVKEAGTRSRAARHPTEWENHLVWTVADAFGCDIYFNSIWSGTRRTGDHVFVGEKAEIAAYAMHVLLRQVCKARQEYMRTKLKRCSVKTKRERAYWFCVAWVAGVASHVKEFVGQQPVSKATSTYMAKRTAGWDDVKLTKRRQNRNTHIDDIIAGRQSAQDAQLWHGVNQGEEQKVLTA